MRARSPRAAREHRKRIATLIDRLGPEPVPCQRCHVRPATDAHELLSRARGGSTDPASGNVVLLCREPCHRWITEHPAEARAQGWALSANDDATVAARRRAANG